MIIVKSIKEKPKKCRDCRLLDESTYDCLINSESPAYATCEEQYEHCPIEEAPDINVGNIDTTTHDSIPAETGKNDEDRTRDDCISRQQAIDAVEKNACNTQRIMDAINNLPSAQPERKTGHWILDRSGAYCCSKCMEPCAGYVMMKPRDKFCKMCGAKMEDERKE